LLGHRGVRHTVPGAECGNRVASLANGRSAQLGRVGRWRSHLGARTDVTRVTSLRARWGLVPPIRSGAVADLELTRLGGMLGVVLSAIVYAFLGLLAGGLAWMTLQLSGTIEEKAKLPLYLIVGGSMAVGAAISLVHLRWRPHGSLGRNHVRPGDAVEIAGFDEESTTIRCQNNRFADELIQANQGAQQVARVA
jgi:hypothetical protein